MTSHCITHIVTWAVKASTHEIFWSHSSQIRAESLSSSKEGPLVWLVIYSRSDGDLPFIRRQKQIYQPEPLRSNLNANSKLQTPSVCSCDAYKLSLNRTGHSLSCSWRKARNCEYTACPIYVFVYLTFCACFLSRHNCFGKTTILNLLIKNVCCSSNTKGTIWQGKELLLPNLFSNLIPPL